MKITSHAVARYKERVKPALDFEQAKRELEALLLSAAAIGDIPTWLDPETLPPSDGYIELSDGICAAVFDGALTTVLIRATSHPTHRANKNAAKARRKAARQSQRRASQASCCNCGHSWRTSQDPARCTRCNSRRVVWGGVLELAVGQARTQRTKLEQKR